MHGNPGQAYSSRLLNRESAGVLAVTATPVTAAELLGRVESAIRSGDPLTIVGHNLHSVYHFHSSDWFREFYDRCEIVLTDGRPVLAAINQQRRSEGLRPYRADRRVGSTDWIPQAFALDEVRRVCVLGATKASNDAMLSRFSRPGIDLLGIPADPWDEDHLAAAASKIRNFDPDLVIIGMGMPLQERVCSELIARDVSAVIALVGGAIDQLSGAQRNAPRWLGPLGLEWMWRLASQPKRLAHRYLVEPVKLALLLTKAR